MGSQGDGGRRLIQREIMGNERAHVEPAGENEPGDFALEREIGRVAADEVFFVEADGGEIKGKSGRRKAESGNRRRMFHFRFSIFDFRLVSLGVGEEQNLAGAAHELERLRHGGIGGDGDDGGIEGKSGKRKAESGNG